jgi:hypothetical protein
MWWVFLALYVAHSAAYNVTGNKLMASLSFSLLFVFSQRPNHSVWYLCRSGHGSTISCRQLKQCQWQVRAEKRTKNNKKEKFFPLSLI